MGKPGIGNTVPSRHESIVSGSKRGEVKHLSTPRKRNQIEIPPVAVSERGVAQTRCRNTPGVVGQFQGIARRVRKSACSGRILERTTKEGDSPVYETRWSLWRLFPSTAGHVESRGKPGGPSSKAKYSLATDSEQVP